MGSTDSPFAFSLETPEGDEAARDPKSENERLAHQLQATPYLLNLALYRLAEKRRSFVVLFVDQLEELYTLVEDPETRGRFMQALCAAADDPAMPVRVIFTLREEFLSRLAEGAGVREALTQMTVLRSPGRGALREILSRPVEAMGYRYEDDRLVEQMVEEVRGEISCLPLLQFAGQHLWDERDPEHRLLKRSVYESMGGVAGALAQHGDGVLAQLPPDELQLARAMVLRLVTPEGTRRVLSQRHLVEGLGPKAGGVLKRLISARLLTAKQSATGEESDLELAHESLIATWTKLRRWVEESREELVFLQEVGQAAEVWERRGQREAELWRGDALRDAERAAEHCTSEPSEQVGRFLAASKRRERRGLWRRRVAVSSAFVVLAALAGAFAVKEREANRERIAAQENLASALHEKADRLIADKNYRAAAVYAAEALAQSPPDVSGASRPPEASPPKPLPAAENRVAIRSLLFQASARSRVRYAGALLGARSSDKRYGDFNLSFSPDGAYLAAGVGTRVSLWELRTGKMLAEREIVTGRLRLSFSPDGKLLATPYSSERVALWRVPDLALARTLSAREKLAPVVRFSPFQATLAAGTRRGDVLLWSIGTEAPPRKLAGSKEVKDLAFSPDGKRLASTHTDARVRVWDLAEGRLSRETAAFKTSTPAIAFSPDGRLFAVSFDDATIRLWNERGHEVGAVRHGVRGPVASLAFSPDRSLLASAGNDGTVRLWSTSDFALLETFFSAEGLVSAVAISPDSRLLAAIGNDDVVRLWRITPRTLARDYVGEHQVNDVTSAPGGGLFFAGDEAGDVHLWGFPGREEHAVLRGHAEPLFGVAISRDGKLLAAAHNDGTVRLWDTGRRALLSVLPGAMETTSGLGALAFSPDGRLLASSGGGRTVDVWGVADGKRVAKLTEHRGAVQAVAFSPAGDLLLTAGGDPSIFYWEARSFGLTRRVPHGHSANVTCLTFHPDGSRFISTGVDGRIKEWRTTTGDLQRSFLGHREWVNRAIYSPDGTLVLSGSDDATARLWDAGTGRLLLSVKSSGQVTGVAFSPEGRHFAVADGHQVALYPVQLDAAGGDPRMLVAEAERDSALKLEGFALKLGEP